MEDISLDEFRRLLGDFKQSAIHLETRDAYGTETEIPHMAKWVAGEPDDLEWLQGWCNNIRSHVDSGATIRRAKIVSEPLSDYQRWAHTVLSPIAKAGEGIRWTPRRLVSSIVIPGNDYYVLDDELVIFMHFSGNGLATAHTASTDPSDVEKCRTAFEQVWALATPHNEYKP
jgi:hypothetical protein